MGDEPFGAETDAREITPLAQAQMQEGELIMELQHAIGKLGERLRPVLSDESMKVDGGNRLSETKPARLSYGSSPTLNMIEQQCENLRSSLEVVRGLTRYLEV